MLRPTPEIEAARRRWRFRGEVRPDFAHADAAHEESVWDYPRPPMIVPDTRLVQVFAEGSLIADVVAAVASIDPVLGGVDR